MAKKSTRKRTKAGSSTNAQYKRFPVDKLLLDRSNPRLVEFTVSKNPTQSDLLQALYQQMAAEELAMSIAYNGYFEHEPLIIEKRSDGKYTVIEGNRRLAAVQLLLSARTRRQLKATDLPNIDSIDAGRRDEISSLPAIVSTRKEMWRYLGFKHVNGPATWGAYAKAQYVAEIHNDYSVPLEDIAKQIGDYSNTVERQYRGLMVIEQAEKDKLFNRENTYRDKFYFNYIYTALDNANFQKFLGIEGKARSLRKPVPAAKRTNLKDLCLWLYGDEKKQIEPLIRSQNPDLQTLGQTISQANGVKALRGGAPLGVAHDVSLGDVQLFRSALRDSKQALQRAHATLSTGYQAGDRDLIDQARDIEVLVNDLVDAMEVKQSREKRRKGAKRSSKRR